MTPAKREPPEVTVHLRLKDWIGLVSVLIIQTTVVVSAWWRLSDRVLILETVATSNRELSVENRELISGIDKNQAAMVELLKRMPRTVPKSSP